MRTLTLPALVFLLYYFNGESVLADATAGTLDLVTKATPEPNWATIGGLGLLVLGFSALALLCLTFLGLSSKGGDLPRDLLVAPMAGLDSGALIMVFFTLHSMGTSPS